MLGAGASAAIVCLLLVLARAVLYYLIFVADALSRRASLFDSGARAVLYLLTTNCPCLLELCLHAWCWCRALFYFFSRSALLLALALRLLVCLVLVLARAVLYLILVAGALSRRACVFDAGARTVLCLLTTGDRVVVSLLAAGWGLLAP